MFKFLLALTFIFAAAGAHATVAQVHLKNYTITASNTRLTMKFDNNAKKDLTCQRVSFMDDIDNDGLAFTALFYSCPKGQTAMFKMFSTVNINRFMLYGTDVNNPYFDEVFPKNLVVDLSAPN